VVGGDNQSEFIFQADVYSHVGAFVPSHFGGIADVGHEILGDSRREIDTHYRKVLTYEI
jgi:hypothetical protein